jgi:hypothetical protein
MSDFTALLAELELKSLKKSIPEDANLQTEEEQDEEIRDESSLGKSITFTDETGTETDAIDGTELVKSLTARIEQQEETFSTQTGELLKVLTEQTGLIKSLQDQINDLASSGRGRKSVLTVAEKPEAIMQKSQPEGMSPDEFMAKAMQANSEGRITSTEISVAEGALFKGFAVPADIVRKVLIS